MGIEILGNILYALIMLCILILGVRIILSWFTLPPYKWLTTLYKYTDPVLNFFKRNFPIRIGLIDLSIIIPLIILYLLLNVVVDLLIIQKPLTPFYPLVLVLTAALYVVSFIFTLLIFFAIILLIVNLLAPGTYNPVITMMRSIIDPIAIRIRKILKLKSKYADTIYLALTALFFILISAACTSLIRIMINILS